MTSHLILADGVFFAGRPIGAPRVGVGEVVFTTCMTGYQEILTDPSFAGQIVVFTYPLIGNYGTNPDDVESDRVQVRGIVVRELCTEPSNWRAGMGLAEYLERNQIPGIAGVDTRAVTRHLRHEGVMMGAVGAEEPEAMGRMIAEAPGYGEVDYVREVSTPAVRTWPHSEESEGPSVALVDYGVKYNICRSLAALGCRVTIFPCTAPADEVMASKPDVVVLSPGPGDPAVLDYAVPAVRDLAGRAPIFGICLGHQLLAHAFGGGTFKLKFGHRGGNHPVADIESGRVAITSQNHGYAVDRDSLAGTGFEVTHLNVNDGTVEGMRHRDLPIMSVQFHPEASPGPRDSSHLFQELVETIG
jgi:carbamoyl-phosphate synthase small subunit